jgi:hypothetical protein
MHTGVVMNLIVFSPSKNRSARRLFDAVERLELDVGLELHRSSRSLFQRLREPAKEILAGVLVLSRQGDLEETFFMQELLHDLSLIIVLPDGENGLVRKAHLLRPRFVSFEDRSLREVPSVLARMVRHEMGTQGGDRLPCSLAGAQVRKGGRCKGQEGGLLA